MPKSMERGEEKGFPPVWDEHARALILGSYPSPKSFEDGFYYGHPQNRFWPLLARLTGCAPPQTTPEKTALLLRRGLALWDVLERCRITGAADSSISHPLPNDIAALVKQSNIQAVFCNGATACALYRRHCQAAVGLPATQLPSTSPANASYSLSRLEKAWLPLKAHLLPD